MTGAGPSRRSHTKSRTGCKTCKRRHIRCDELFPQWYARTYKVDDGADPITVAIAQNIRFAAITWTMQMQKLPVNEAV